MDYPLVHTKLVTRVANAYLHNVTADFLDKEWGTVNVFDLSDIKVKELHAYSSYIKVAASWNMQEALRISRELCGGHGFSTYSYLPILINDCDVHITWEGTNEVLLQQTCKNLLEEFNQFRTKNKINYESLKFLEKFDKEEIKIGDVISRLNEMSEKLYSEEFKHLLQFSETPISIKDLNKSESFFDEFSHLLEIIMQQRFFNMIDKCLSKFAQFLTQIKSTKNNFFRSFSKTLPYVLFPTASFFGELFCLKTFRIHLNNIGNSNPQTPLFKTTSEFKDIKKEEYLNEKVYFQKMMIIFALSTICNSVEFLSDSDEGFDFDFFNNLQDAHLKLTESVRYDILGKLFIIFSYFNLKHSLIILSLSF